MSAQLAVVLIAAAWSGAVGVLGLLLGRRLRRTSLRWLPAGVALVAVLAVAAGVVGTARAMFLSVHDFRVVLVVVLVAGVVALAFSMLAGATVVRASRSLREDTRRFAESGRFTAEPAAERAPVEFAQLSDELTRTSTRLAESRDREARLDRSRRELVSWVSHDLRTPLAGLRAMTEALEDGLAEEPQRYYAQMRAEVDRMVRMVDDLFELSKIHAGVIAPALETVELGDLVSEAIAGARPVARAQRVRLGGFVDDGVMVHADPAGLSRVVANLLMNAIRHTPADGVVQITGRAVGDCVEIAVRDACGGIPEEDIGRVFDVAWRGGHARTPEPGPGSAAGSGAGLGLAIVKGIVEAHQGSVSVVNAAPGCRFQVRIPG